LTFLQLGLLVFARPSTLHAFAVRRSRPEGLAGTLQAPDVAMPASRQGAASSRRAARLQAPPRPLGETNHHRAGPPSARPWPRVSARSSASCRLSLRFSACLPRVASSRRRRSSGGQTEIGSQSDVCGSCRIMWKQTCQNELLGQQAVK